MKKLCAWLVIIFFLLLAACAPSLQGNTLDDPTAIAQSAGAQTAVTEPVPSYTPMTASPSPSPSWTATVIDTATPVPSATLDPTGTLANTPTSTPSITPSPSPTPWPTPANLPPDPNGWRWQLHATGIPVTHYIIYELSPDDWDASLERPYGLDDQPLPGIELLPKPFLQQVAYQGSGRLPNGDILQYAALRPPVEQGLVPFRYVITPSEQCAGHPRAGNGTCSIPLETAATTWREGEERLVPVGSTIFIPELNRKVRINDVAISDGPSKIDLYTGTDNNYDYERPDGATIWILTEDSD